VIRSVSIAISGCQRTLDRRAGYITDGKRYRITTSGDSGNRNAARVKTYGDLICDKQTVGLLQRRHIHIDYIKGIGKETNNLDDVESRHDP